MIETREYTSQDFSLLASWWQSRQQVDLSPSILSDTGYIALSDGQPIAALFLYPIQGSEVCWIGWPISDQESPSEARSEALDALFEVVHLQARDRGYKLVWTTSGVPVVQQRLERHGYEMGDENIKQYWKGL